MLPLARRSDRFGVATMLAATLAVSPTLAAADYSQTLLGDWDGLRSALGRRGVDLEISYINELAHNTRGGDRDLTTDADQVYFGGSFNLSRILEIPGAKIYFSVTDRNGESLSVKAHLGTLLEVQEIYGEGNFTRLNQLYWEQTLFNQAMTVKVGRLTGTFDFMPFSCEFQNIAFCATIPSHNVVPDWVAFPGGTWAAVARFAFHRDWYAQAGVYEVDPELQRHGSRFSLHAPFGGLGQRWVAELGWLPKLAGPDGGYRVGAWYDNVGGNDLFFNTHREPLSVAGGAPLRHRQQSGFYCMAQQRVWAQADSNTRGISLFVNFVATDRQITIEDQIVEAGLFWKGAFASRPQDDIGVALGRVHVNRHVASGEALYDVEVAQVEGLPPLPVQSGAEYPFEIHYGVNLGKGITLRPNLQIIRSPGGVSSRPYVLVLGLHSSIQL